MFYTPGAKEGRTLSERSARFVISVLTRDRVGVIAAVSEALYALDGNLEALSQTVVWGWFTMIVCGCFPEDVTPERVKEAIEGAGDFSATVFPFGAEAPSACGEGEPFVVSAVGADKPGIVRRLTRSFAGNGINIDDVWNEVRGGQFVVIFHVTMPRDVDRKEVRYALEGVGRELGVSVMLQHQDIFTATNSLSVHTRRRRK